MDSYLCAINPDGTQKWIIGTVDYGPAQSSPAIGADGIIYVTSEDNYLYAINPDGTQKWKFPTHTSVYSSPAIGADGTIYVGSLDNYLYAIGNNGLAKKGPVVSISTDKFKYCPGDTMLVILGISNPTSDPVTFKGYLGIPTSDIWTPVTSVPIPAGFVDTIKVTLHTGEWSETPFSAVWYVDLQDPETGQELAADCACWSYCPAYGEEAATMSMPILLEDIANETGEEIEGCVT